MKQNKDSNMPAYEWELLKDDSETITDRMRFGEGWLVRTRVYNDGSPTEISVAMVFVRDENGR